MELLLQIKEVFFIFITYLGIFLGNYDLPMQTLMTFIVVNLLLCIFVNYFMGNHLLYEKCISFTFINKIIVFSIIAVSASLDRLTSVDALHHITIYFFIAKEGLSILNYSSMLGIEYPKSIKKALDQLSDKQSDKE